MTSWGHWLGRGRTEREERRAGRTFRISVDPVSVKGKEQGKGGREVLQHLEKIREHAIALLKVWRE